MKTGWLVGGLAALVLIIGGGWLLMRGPAGSGPATLFQWQDYMEPPFLADYEKAFHEKPAITIFADEDEAFAKMRAGFKPDAFADAVARALAAGYVDDERVAVERARRLAERDASDAGIRAELVRRGVPEDAVEAAIAAIPSEPERAERLAHRLGGGARAARALVRKGYPEDLVGRVLRMEIAE